jgi:hypothetical protein
MTDTKANEATRNLIKSVQDTNKAIADSTVSSQERTLAFAQSVLENGIEVLRSHAESVRTMMQELVDQAKKQKLGSEGLQTLVDNAIAAQERNVRLAQSILENGAGVLKDQADATRDLMQELSQQFQKQQEAFLKMAQESIEAYRSFVLAPLNFWQKALSSVESATMDGLKNFQKVTEQGLEDMQKATHQAIATSEEAVRNASSATEEATE